MTTHKVYGYCMSCYSGIISVVKSDKTDNTNVLYFCPKCNTNSTFDFTNSDEIKRRIEEKRKRTKK